MDSKTKRKINQIKARVIKGEVEPFLKRKKARQKARTQYLIHKICWEAAEDAWRLSKDW